MILADISNIKQQDKAGSLLSESVALLLGKEEAIDELTRVIEVKSGVISEQKKRILILEEVLRLSKIKRFGSSSEQSHQSSLFDEAENEADSSEELDQEADEAPEGDKQTSSTGT
ncbi:hypothetical protein [Methyloprofundus sp.]